MKRKQVINLIKKDKTLRITRIGRGWIDVKSLTNGIEMRWWNFMWEDLTKRYLV